MLHTFESYLTESPAKWELVTGVDYHALPGSPRRPQYGSPAFFQRLEYNVNGEWTLCISLGEAANIKGAYKLIYIFTKSRKTGKQYMPDTFRVDDYRMFVDALKGFIQSHVGLHIYSLPSEKQFNEFYNQNMMTFRDDSITRHGES